MATQHAAGQLGLDAAAMAALRRARPALLAAMPGILDRFYAMVLADPALAPHFAAPGLAERAKAAQATHWARLFDGGFDEEYRQSVRRIGLAHHRIELRPEPYIAGYGFVLGELLAVVVQAAPGRLLGRRGRQALAGSLAAVARAVLLDISLAIGAYTNEEAVARANLIDGMVRRIDEQSRDTVEGVAGLTEGLEASASQLVSASAAVDRDSHSAALAADSALSSAETVAAAAEQLHASIAEIGRQVAEASRATGEAVARMRGGHDVMRRLGEAASEIGTVVGLIREIANRTNLLALNATIEAARAGEAGRGFAVVAGEVKSLAGQSARSTTDIGQRIATIQDVVADMARTTGDTEAAVGRVEHTATAIAAAVEQQTAATSEIARSIGMTARSAAEVNQMMKAVRTSGQQARDAAEVVSASAERLNEAMVSMGRQMSKAVRTSSPLADRRGRPRRAVLLDAELTIAGQRSAAAMYDLSEDGAMFAGDVACPPGAAVTIAVPAQRLRLEGTVLAASHGQIRTRFTGTGLPSAQVDSIARAGIARLVDVTKGDHRAWVARIEDAVAGKCHIDPMKLTTHHTCRLGRWCDGVTDEAITATAAFANLREPHRQVHAAGRAALLALQSGRAEAVRDSIASLHAASGEVIAQLDRLQIEYTQRAAA